MNKTDLVEKPFLRTDLPDFRPGDTVKVHVRVVEGSRERIQVFQGVVIRRSGGGIRETFTVRKISFGVGVERTFPLHSPSIGTLEMVQHGRVRRAKLYYLRDLRGKKARIKERRIDDAKLAALAAVREAAAADAEEDVPEAVLEIADAAVQTEGGHAEASTDAASSEDGEVPARDDEAEIGADDRDVAEEPAEA